MQLFFYSFTTNIVDKNELQNGDFYESAKIIQLCQTRCV